MAVNNALWAEVLPASTTAHPERVINNTVSGYQNESIESIKPKQRQQVAPVATEHLSELVPDSPFLDLQHPIGIYEGCKLLFMFPVVIMKVSTLSRSILTRYMLKRMLAKPYNSPEHASSAPYCLQWAVLMVILVFSWSVLELMLAGSTRGQPLGPIRQVV